MGLKFEFGRWSVWAALMCAVAMCCTACDKAPGGTEKVSIRMWTFPMLPELRDQEIYDELVKRFEAEHPEIDVKIETLPWVGRTQKLITAIAGNRAPDCVYLNLDLVAQLASRDSLLPMEDYLSEEAKADYGQELLDATMVDGHLYMFPMLRTIYAGIYNRTILEQVGLDPDSPPTNWEELQELADLATKDTDGDGYIDQFGLGVPLGGDSLNNSLWPLLWQAGGQVFTDDGKRVAFNSPEGVESLTFLSDLFKQGAIPRSYLSTSGGSEFSRGRVAYWFCAGSVELVALRRDVPHLDIDVAPILKHRERLSYGSVAGYGMIKNSKHPKETATWLNFITRPDNMKFMCRGMMYFPSKKSVGKIYDDDPLMSKLEAELPYTRPDVNHIHARSAPQVLVPEMQDVLLGKKTPEQALDYAEKAVNAILERDK